MNGNKFQVMFRGQQVIIEYKVYGREIDYAIITNDNEDFVHPDYEDFNDELDKFHQEVYSLTKRHLKNIVTL